MQSYAMLHAYQGHSLEPVSEVPGTVLSHIYNQNSDIPFTTEAKIVRTLLFVYAKDEIDNNSLRFTMYQEESYSD